MELNITLADVLTPAGFIAASAFVTGLVEVGKRITGALLTGREQPAVAVLAALMVGLAMFDRSSTMPLVLGDILVAAAAWYGITRLAMGIHDDAAQKPGSLTGPAA